MKRLAIAAGGTGGHITPAVHIAHKWQDQGGECVWFGRSQSLEQDVAMQNGIEFIHQAAVPLNWVKLPKTLRLLSHAVYQARRQLMTQKVDAVFSTGAYVSFPTALAAKTLRLPLIIHEQNTHMGKANALLSKLTKHVCLGLPISGMNQHVVTGNPVFPRPIQRRDRHILVIGGSQGCAFFNKYAAKCVAKANTDFPVVHLAGQKDQGVAQRYAELKIKAQVHRYHHAIHELYNDAVIVIARAGAMTLAELSYFGIPSILVPYPHATNDHQKKNAQYFVKRHAAVMIDEDPKQLGQAIDTLLNDSDHRKAIASMISSLVHEDACQHIIKVINDAMVT